MDMKLGYPRVSTTDQDARMQIAALVEAGVGEDKIFIDHMSAAKTAKERPGLTELLKYARDGDQVYCWRIDRLGRSLIDVLNTVDEMTKKGIALYSLFDGVDPSTPPNEAPCCTSKISQRATDGRQLSRT